MDLLTLGFLALMGILAGAINSAVGSGSLLTLPVLLAAGLPPGTAVRTNTIGMFFSTVGSVAGYRREIARELPRLRPLIVSTLLFAALGSCLLLATPNDALRFVVPILIVVALVLVVFQKPMTRAIRRAGERRAERRGVARDPEAVYRSPALLVPMSGAAVYGGFFTAAQGILYMGVLGAVTGRDMKDINPIKNLLSLIVNLTAAVVYLMAHVVLGAPVSWAGVLAVGMGTLIGGYAGSYVAKRLPEAVLRGTIVVVALAALARQLWG